VGRGRVVAVVAQELGQRFAKFLIVVHDEYSHMESIR
jgi:hypothetical protein